MPLQSLPVLRRTTFATAPLLALGACRWGPAPGSSPDTPEDGPAPPDDEANVTAATAAITATHALITAVTERHIGLAGAFAPLLDMHTGHLDLLDAPVATGQPAGNTPRVSARSAVAWQQVVSAEDTTQATLARLGAEVSSGQLARVLAAMAAGVAQHLSALPPAPKGSA